MRMYEVQSRKVKDGAWASIYPTQQYSLPQAMLLYHEAVQATKDPGSHKVKAIFGGDLTRDLYQVRVVEIVSREQPIVTSILLGRTAP